MEALRASSLRQFLALQEFLVPRSRELNAQQKARSVQIVNQVLAQKAARDRFKLKLFFWLIDLVSFCRGFCSFAALPPAKKKAVMDFFFSGPVGLFRKGFWGVNTLAKMSVYAQETLHAELRYARKQTPP